MRSDGQRDFFNQFEGWEEEMPFEVSLSKFMQDFGLTRLDLTYCYQSSFAGGVKQLLL